MEYYEIDLLKNKVLKAVERIGDDQIFFVTSENECFIMHHEQDCCEYVCIEDVCGDLSDLVGSPILQAEEAFRTASNDECSESGTWTFYKFATIKGAVTIRWLGESNGYYSESAQISTCQYKDLPGPVIESVERNVHLNFKFDANKYFPCENLDWLRG